MYWTIMEITTTTEAKWPNFWRDATLLRTFLGSIQQNRPGQILGSYKKPELSHTCYSKDETSGGFQHVCTNLSIIPRLKNYHSFPNQNAKNPFCNNNYICAIYMYNMYIYHNIYEISSRDNTHHFFLLHLYPLWSSPLDQPNLWFFGFRGCSGSFGTPRVRLTADGMSNKTLSTFHSTDWFMGILRLALLLIIPI